MDRHTRNRMIGVGRGGPKWTASATRKRKKVRNDTFGPASDVRIISPETGEVVRTEKAVSNIYSSPEWARLRYQALKMNDGRCECCGRGREEGVTLHVDHIKPRSKHPALALKLSNLQVLCEDCNIGKGNWDQTDWRDPNLAALMGERLTGLN